MGVITSKWPGKCRQCGAKHKAMDPVYWDKGTKGVLCMSCANKDAPKEDDELKVPKVATLKRGHRLSIVPASYDILDMYGIALHHTSCRCLGCMIRAYGTYGYRPYTFGHTFNSGKYLPPGLALRHEDRMRFAVGRGEFQNVLFFHNDPAQTFVAQIPIGAITEHGGPNVEGMTLLRVVPGAPDTSVLDPYAMTEVQPIVYGGSVKEFLNQRAEPRPPIFGLDLRLQPPLKFSAEPREELITSGPVPLAKAHFLDSKTISPNGINAHNPECTCSKYCRITGTMVGCQQEQLEMRSMLLVDHQLICRIGLAGDCNKEDLVPIRLPYPFDAYDIAARSGMIITDPPAWMTDGTPAPVVLTNGATATPDSKEAPTTVTANLSDAAVSLVAALQASAVPEAKVREIALETITQELKKLPAKNHKIKFNDAPPMEFEGTMHGMATEIMEAILCGFHNIMVVGPAGSGKTFLFSQIAQLIKKEMKWDESDYAASMSCAPGQTESMFIGRMIPSLTTGQEIYHGTNLTRLYAKENGGAFLFDEISNSEPTVMNLVNAMIALDGHVTLPDGRVLSRPKNMVVFAADNTWGQGGDRMYIRNQLDAATLDRFTGAKFFMDYDEKLEQALCPMKEVYESVAQLRQKVSSLKLRRIVSTRAFAAAHRMGSNGMSSKNILKRLTIDWSENDRKSVGV